MCVGGGQCACSGLTGQKRRVSGLGASALRCPAAVCCCVVCALTQRWVGRRGVGIHSQPGLSECLQCLGREATAVQNRCPAQQPAASGQKQPGQGAQATPKRGKENGEWCGNPGGMRTSATAGTNTVTGPETTHRERRGVEAIRLGGYGMCVLGIRHIQKSKGATGMRCRVERAGEETSQAGSRRWSRQSLSSLARSSTNGTINHQSSRSSEGIENHETDYVGAPNRQAGVDNGWETEERRPGLTSAPIASGSGRSGRARAGCFAGQISTGRAVCAATAVVCLWLWRSLLLSGAGPDHAPRKGLAQRGCKHQPGEWEAGRATALSSLPVSLSSCLISCLWSMHAAWRCAADLVSAPFLGSTSNTARPSDPQGSEFEFGSVLLQRKRKPAPSATAARGYCVCRVKCCGGVLCNSKGPVEHPC